MNRFFVGDERTQGGSRELTVNTSFEWAEPPNEGMAMAFARLIVNERRGEGFAEQILRAEWVPIREGEGIEYVLWYLVRDEQGCLHTCLAVLLG